MRCCAAAEPEIPEHTDPELLNPPEFMVPMLPENVAWPGYTDSP